MMKKNQNSPWANLALYVSGIVDKMIGKRHYIVMLSTEGLTANEVCGIVFPTRHMAETFAKWLLKDVVSYNDYEIVAFRTKSDPNSNHLVPKEFWEYYKKVCKKL